ncbi:hypothetical protein CK203_028135 [Vitis vinifera]|uniref:Uncharacterized protein n=1 Tax=Vitis vinifera TaxID=29760 RepID=A0A438IAT0_VITVI|nr:hypothetical protein CK203_028135 [Vitis vinifera]
MIERQLQQGQPWCPSRWVKEEDNQLFQWVRLIHLHDEVGNPDPRIAAHAREFGVNVEHVLSGRIDLSAAGTSSSSYDGSRDGTDDEGDNREEILMNVNIVNIQSANLLVKMISHTAHMMKTMVLEELVQA